MDATDDSISFGSSIHNVNSHELLDTKEHDKRKRFRQLSHAVAVASLHTSCYMQILLYLMSALQLMQKRKPNHKRKANVHHDHSSVINFIRSWDDDMFKGQFWLSWEFYYLLESLILYHKCQNGYNYEQHMKYATKSSGSPITLELWLFITPHLCSGAMYLDIIWYGISWRLFLRSFGLPFVTLMKQWIK